MARCDPTIVRASCSIRKSSMTSGALGSTTRRDERPLSSGKLREPETVVAREIYRPEGDAALAGAADRKAKIAERKPHLNRGHPETPVSRRRATGAGTAREGLP